MLSHLDELGNWISHANQIWQVCKDSLQEGGNLNSVSLNVFNDRMTSQLWRPDVKTQWNFNTIHHLIESWVMTSEMNLAVDVNWLQSINSDQKALVQMVCAVRNVDKGGLLWQIWNIHNSKSLEIEFTANIIFDWTITHPVNVASDCSSLSVKHLKKQHRVTINWSITWSSNDKTTCASNTISAISASPALRCTEWQNRRRRSWGRARRHWRLGIVGRRIEHVRRDSQTLWVNHSAMWIGRCNMGLWRLWCRLCWRLCGWECWLESISPMGTANVWGKLEIWNLCLDWLPPCINIKYCREIASSWIVNLEGVDKLFDESGILGV